MHGRARWWAGLAAALLLGGCNEICTPTAVPPASCVRIALGGGGGGQGLMVITPECGIVDTDVRVNSQFTGTQFTVHVDAEGRSGSQPLVSPTMDQLELSWGGDCKTQFCALVAGPGPARECDDFPGDLPR
jgi:hypothetical protein